MQPVSRRRLIEDARQSRSWPNSSLPVYQRQGSTPAYSDTLPSPVSLYETLSPQKQREFWQLRTDHVSKQAFLLRWGQFEQSTKDSMESTRG